MFIHLPSTLAGRIDHGHHANKAFLALHDTVELGKAVEIATNITKPSSVLFKYYKSWGIFKENGNKHTSKIFFHNLFLETI